MKEFEFKDIDWPLIRQTLSISLMKNEPVLLKGAFASISALHWIMPIYSDLKKVIIETGFGCVYPSRIYGYISRPRLEELWSVFYFNKER